MVKPNAIKPIGDALLLGLQDYSFVILSGMQYPDAICTHNPYISSDYHLHTWSYMYITYVYIYIFIYLSIYLFIYITYIYGHPPTAPRHAVCTVIYNITCSFFMFTFCGYLYMFIRTSSYKQKHNNSLILFGEDPWQRIKKIIEPTQKNLETLWEKTKKNKKQNKKDKETKPIGDPAIPMVLFFCFFFVLFFWFFVFFLILVLFSHCRKTKQKLSMAARQWENHGTCAASVVAECSEKPHSQGAPLWTRFYCFSKL